MKLNKNKIIIIIIAAILIIGGIIAFIMLKTDKFKSNEDLFWQYMSQNSEIINIIKNEKDDRYIDKSYTKMGNIRLESTNTINLLANLLQEYETDESLKIIDIATNESYNIEENKKYFKIDAKYKDATLCETEILKEEDIYAIQNKEVANGFIAVKNENIKQMASNLGINPENVPDKIIKNDYSNLLDISSEEKTHIIKTYFEVIKNNINKDKYSKRDDIAILIENEKYTVNAYSLTLTETEFQNLLIAALEKLSTDSITLNLIATKFKTMNLPEKYTDVNELNKQITKLTEQINEKEASNEEYLKFSVYESNGKTISTDIEFINKKTIGVSFNKATNTIIVNQKKLNENAEKDITNKYGKIIFKKTCNSEEEKIELKILEKDANSEILNMEMTKQKTEKGYTTNGRIYTALGINISYSDIFTLETPTEIPTLENSPKIILNNLEKEKMNNIVKKLLNRINTLIEEKQKMIGIIERENKKDFPEIDSI